MEQAKTIYIHDKEYSIKKKEIKTTEDEFEMHYEVVDGVLEAYGIDKAKRQEIAEVIAPHLSEINILISKIKA